MDTIAEVWRPATVEDVKEWQSGYAWMAGGTRLMSMMSRQHESNF